jgi:hypothetical protein
MAFGATTKELSLSAIEGITDTLNNYSQTWIDTALSGYYRMSGTLILDEAGVDLWEYYGPDDNITRPFCQMALQEEPKSKDEWDAMSDDPLREGQPNPVSVYCGGYRCRHRLIPIIE